MDFRFSDEQQALKDLARQILADHATHDRLKQLEADGGSVFDRDLWKALADAGVLGSAVPEQHGGAGYGLLELLPVFEEAGRHVAPVPLVTTLVGALAIARFGDDALQSTWLPRIVSGDAVLAAALEDEAGADGTAVTATHDSHQWRLTGTRPFVPYAAEVDLVIVPAKVDGQVGLFVVSPGDGLTVTTLLSTNRQPLGHLELASAPAWTLVTPGAEGAAAVRWLTERTAAAYCVVQAGVCEGAVRMMATHASNREQFGKKIAEFQAVAQRAADAFIDTQMVRLAAWQAIFRLSMEWEATNEVAVAKFWAGDGAMRAVHAAQHIHGGLGVDTDYPVHRYFLWAKQIEHTLGTPTRSLIALGAALAAEPV